MIVQTSIINKITTKNLVTFSLAQTQLENNFQYILKALKNHQSLISNITNNQTLLENQAKSKFNQIDLNTKDIALNKNDIAGLNSKISELKLLTSKMQYEKVSRNQLQNLNNKVKKETVNPQALVDYKNENKQLSAMIKKLSQKFDNLSTQHEKIHHEIFRQNDTNSIIRQLEEQTKSNKEKIRQLDALIAKINNSNFQKQKEIKDKIIEDFALLRKEISLMKQNMNENFENVKDQLNKHNEKINQHEIDIAEISKNLKKMMDEIWKINDHIYKPDLQAVIQMENIKHSISKLQDWMTQVKRNQSPRKTIQEETNHKDSHFKTSYNLHSNKDKDNIFSKDKDNLLSNRELNQQDSEFKRDILDRLKQQKVDFGKAIKRIDGMSFKKDQDKNRLDKLQQKALRIQHALNNYVDNENFKKWVKFIENKLNYLYRVINLENAEEDACIARKNWICLSCDKKLDAYKGKLGPHLSIAQLKTKGIDNEIIGGGMLFKNRSRMQLTNSVKK